MVTEGDTTGGVTAVFQDRLERDIEEDHPMGEMEIEIIDVSGDPKSEFSERIPGLIITSKFCTCVDSPELINKTETSTRRDLPSDRAIVKSQPRPSASVHSVDLKFRDSD